MLAQILIELAQVDAWLDDKVSQPYKDQPLAQDWARVSKVIEEAGEAVNELILLTGQNPRKPKTDNRRALLDELADTAITAILAIQHFTKDESATGAVLVDKVQATFRRMALAKQQAKLAALRDGRPSQEAQRAFNHSLGL